MIRNQYNQVPHLTQDTKPKMDTAWSTLSLQPDLYLEEEK